MKKLLVAAFAAVLAVAFVVPASALENKFGGYWRTRAFTMQDFSGDDTESMDRTMVDTRTRFFYTATLNDNLKFVNAFEFDADWGDSVLGDIGTDGVAFEIKHSYADFNWANLNFKLGMQPLVLQRAFLFDDDFAGAVITYKTGNFEIPFVWVKESEGHVNATTANDPNDMDLDMYVLYPKYTISDDMSARLLLAYATQDDSDTDAFFVGVDFDATFDAFSMWFTGIYEGGENLGVDLDAFLLAIGGTYDFGDFDVHGQIFMATGDESGNDMEAFTAPTGQAYYWSEIMGLGTFDDYGSAGSPAGRISNIVAGNIGIKYVGVDKLKLSADLWYAELEEDDAFGEDELGLEVDLKATYQLIEGLNLDVIAAYLFAGDATGGGDEDPYEIGTRLSLSF